MITKQLIICIFFVGVLNGPIASAAVDETRAMPADGRVQVDNPAGSIEITGWDRNEVHITGELGDGVEALEVTESATGVTVIVRNRENQRFIEETDLHLKVPVAAGIIAEGISSDIDVRELDGGGLYVKTTSGDIDVDVSSVHVEIESVSGDVSFRGSAPRISAKTVSGEISLAGVDGEIRVSSVSGDIELEAGVVSIGRIDNVSGDLEAMLQVAGDGQLTVDSISGDVRITLPENQQGQFSATTSSGDIRSAFGKVDTERRGPGSHLDHRAGSGGSIIRVRSASGDIRIGQR